MYLMKVNWTKVWYVGISDKPLNMVQLKGKLALNSGHHLGEEDAERQNIMFPR
jgi:hypothetical protein